MGYFNNLKNNLNEDDEDQFQISKVPGVQSVVGNEETNDSVEPESSPIDLAVGMGAAALAEKALPEAAQIIGNETGSLDLSGLKKLLTNSADDVAGAVTPNNYTPTGTGVSAPNANALETQIRNRQVDALNRAKLQRYQSLQNKLNRYRQGM